MKTDVSITGPILVTGATGLQGGHVAATLLKAGKTVRALVRNPNSDEAQALQAAGAELVQGDMLDRNSLTNALTGVEGVFSVQVPSREEDTSEIDAGQALIDTAFEAGVRMFVHTSVARAGDQENFVDWANGRWNANYWNSKSTINDTVINRGFEFYTILKPALIMANYSLPRSQWMYPTLVSEGKLVTATELTAKLDLIAPEDIGAFAFAAFENPRQFNEAVIDLAGCSLTSEEVAAALTRGTGHLVVAEYVPKEQLIQKGYSQGIVQAQEWLNVEGYQVDIAALPQWGIPLTSFDEWIEGNIDSIKIGKPN